MHAHSANGSNLDYLLTNDDAQKKKKKKKKTFWQHDRSARGILIDGTFFQLLTITKGVAIAFQ